jgi:hypothetical protein
MPDTKVNPKQELFCQLYATDKEFFGNGVQAYAEAYAIDLSVRGAYKTAQVNASRLLSNAIVLNRINELLELRGLNDAFVDKQLEFLVTQNAELGTKLSAIKEYNALKSRVTKKLQLGNDPENPINTLPTSVADEFNEFLEQKLKSSYTEPTR